MGLVEQLAALLQTEHSGAHEHITAALLCLVQNNPKAVHECLRPELNLLSYLQSTKKLLEDKEEFLVSANIGSRERCVQEGTASTCEKHHPKHCCAKSVHDEQHLQIFDLSPNQLVSPPWPYLPSFSFHRRNWNTSTNWTSC